MAALLFADLAVETTMKAALVQKNSDVPKNATAPQLIDAIAREYPLLGAGQDLAMVRRIREARNPVQHAAATVGPGTLDALLNDADEILNVLLRAAFNIELRSISMISLVANDELRAALEKAYELSSAGDLDTALLCVVAAFDSVRIRAGRWVRKAMGIPEMHDRLGPWVFSKPAIDVFGREHRHSIEPAGDWREWVPLMLGVSLTDQVALQLAKDRCDEVRNAADGKADVPAQPFSREDVQDVIEIAARNIWRLEAAQPQLFLHPNRAD